ncbi:class I SAM-dependent methyltransferase [Paenibacillus hunanensis]|uniref:Ubiquinone/menaquinone biosynthesis C-methylase UbiE n=1 Tax=Paenibacillus hunanensis TaxID=539262 RepID=A0ABU1J810_9BACL|nr:class I SAM-dependent methyltransferase [Paenibacillus hunanensis]MDR6246672.1 ubiquinone/menaquinone biosynthesis C-methylase UbiE [Paenibacillus hunanensis]GGJ32426.1 methyltransferase [Paenibacillus hunanensis]
MPINFHDEQNRGTYATRKADQSWIDAISEHVEIAHKRIADIGCGGGIYTRALIEMGAEQVTGVDFSDEMLKAAAHNCRQLPATHFQKGTADQTHLSAQAVDIVLERALIHHLDDLHSCFKEAARILQQQGILIIQDRTPEDCLLPGDPNHIRGYFFERFPRLQDRETTSRYDSVQVEQSLVSNGMRLLHTVSLWETRRVYANMEELEQDLLQRTGRSILHELTDDELRVLVDHTMDKRSGHPLPIVEQDRWTIWFAVKEG